MTRQEYKDIYDVVGAAMEVYNTLGRGMAEPIYQEARAVEMKNRGILLNFGEKYLRSERYLYIPENDDFVLLMQDNYKDYIVE